MYSCHYIPLYVHHFIILLKTLCTMSCDSHVITVAKHETDRLLSAASTNKQYSHDENLENNRKGRVGGCTSSHI